MTVSREDRVAITMTGEEWDAVRGKSYADRARYGLFDKIEEATGPSEERREAARLEAEAKLPPLTSAVRRRLYDLVGELIAIRESEGHSGDHLGCGDGWPKGLGGWSVTCIYATSPSPHWPNMLFSRTPVWFDHRELPMTENEKSILRSFVGGRREIGDVWGGGSWLSITWKPKTQ